MSAWRPGPANSRNATRPSVFAPTSITARSFSIPTTLPLTTVPSDGVPPWVNDSSSIAAKSSRDGVAEPAAGVAMNSPALRAAGLRDWAFRARGPKALRAFGATDEQRPGAIPSDRNDGLVRARRHKSGRSRLILHDGSAVSPASGLLGRLRRCRWRPG